jgi:beta-fructofuranosidase
VSADLVHWEHWPIALSPTPGGPDKDGVWSGCAVDDHGVPTIFYTGVSPQVQCLATSHDGLRTWEKYPGNPIIATAPEGVIAKDFRDPCVWREGQEWRMVVGSGVEGVGGITLLYRSRDLRQWEYLHPLCQGRKEETGTIWECPNFFALGDKHVLLISPIPLGKTLYLVGSYINGFFTPEMQGVVDNGGCYYAPQFFTDAQGRRLLWGWLWEGRTREAQWAAGWAGVMSLPRLLSLRADGSLASVPAPEVEALRRKHTRLAEVALAPGELWSPPGVRGNTLEIIATFPPPTGPLALRLCRSAQGESTRLVQGEEETLLRYDPQTQALSVDRTHASNDPATQHDVRSDTVRLAPGEALQLRVFIDRSVIEVFANGGVALSSRIYPTRADSLGLAVEAERGGRVTLDVWEMEDIWT